jgi:phage shock protein PspC (stress-responsive transcriptional regulator)
MPKERYRTDTLGSDTNFDSDFLYDDIERIRAQEEEIEKDENNKLGFAGMMALVAGIGLVVSGALFGLMPAGIFEFLEAALPVIGFGAIGYGFYKTMKLAFRKKQLSFPSLNVYRKKKPVKAKPGAQTAETQTENKRFVRPDTRFRRPEARVSSRRRTGVMGRSKSNRIFSGVAGGLSEYTGISAALIRFAFIAATFMSSGMFVFVYLLLSIILPPQLESADPDKS